MMKPEGNQNQGNVRPTQTASALGSSVSVESEPSAGNAPVPIWLIGALGLLLYIGDLYVVDHGGFRGNGFDSRVYYPYVSLEDVQNHQPQEDLPEGWALGKAKFGAYCAGCHGAEGQGTPANNYPPLAGSQWVGGEHADRVIRIVLNAVIGSIDVAGKTYDNPGMVPWRDAIKDDAEIAGIITYIRGSWGNKASPVTAAEVAAIRKNTESRGKQWTATELNDIKP